MTTHSSLLLSPELLSDLMREKPLEADGIDSVVVVDNVPQVGPERLEKLKNVVNKIFSKFGKITNEFWPMDNGMTKGYNHASVTTSVKFCYTPGAECCFIGITFELFCVDTSSSSTWPPPRPRRL